ncbi:TetR/AcrR family transcriptional regulator [Nocardia carnea]|uniref:TetR/AcrR family transcriptional regulator n=1 Tax=Nocardia carnea TaxID=37328 RepID=A0ABW7TW58_9NOCA|nr:TetR/AcrR family transcriptional regulator [Nocardia carnea]
MLIDHEQRRAELAVATWKVIQQKGVAAVSLRTVAAEAGLSTGSLRHVFPTKSDLLAFSMELVHRRFSARAEKHNTEQSPDLVAWLCELLPLDDERRLEMDVNLALFAEGGASPPSLRMRELTATGIHDVCRHALQHPGIRSHLRADLDFEWEVRRLAVLIDGLALQLQARTPLLTPESAVKILRDHIEHLRAH